MDHLLKSSGGGGVKCVFSNNLHRNLTSPNNYYKIWSIFVDSLKQQDVVMIDRLASDPANFCAFFKSGVWAAWGAAIPSNMRHWKQCSVDAGPTSKTSGQHQPNIVSMSHFCGLHDSRQLLGTRHFMETYDKWQRVTVIRLNNCPESLERERYIIE